MGLLYADPVRLNMCRQREDFNRDAAINKCYSGRVVLSVYAAFLVEWLAHFPGDQLLALPMEGLDKTPRAWLGGIYAFLGLRPPKEVRDNNIYVMTHPLMCAREYYLRRLPAVGFRFFLASRQISVYKSDQSLSWHSLRCFSLHSMLH